MKKRPPSQRVAVLAVLRVALVALGLSAVAARPAQARLIDLRASARAGGVGGWGTTEATPDFFDRRRGPGAGVEVGAKLLFIDLSLSFTQLFDGATRGGTFSQALLGFTFDIPVGNQIFQGGVEKGKSRNVIRPIVNAGLAIGTPEPVMGTLNDAQISYKGFVSYTGVGFEHFLNEFLAVGAQVDFGYHFFVGGGKSPFTMTQTHSAGYNLDGYATFTFHLGY
jgi:hypothetical protein